MEPWRRLDTATVDEARDLLRSCCGSSAWIERMIARRPFGGKDALHAAARDEWFALSHDDWREAFRHHPMIGDREALRRRFAAVRHLSEVEQAGVRSAPDSVLDALAEGNQAYRDKFGFIFIVCATGKSAAEMLRILRGRLRNDLGIEIRIAAAEHVKITELRLLALTARPDATVL